MNSGQSITEVLRRNSDELEQNNNKLLDVSETMKLEKTFSAPSEPSFSKIKSELPNI